jgi:phage/plasmid-like protein (TIGR03299 family)
MAHEIEGNKFVGTEVAWHAVGTVIDHPMTAEEAIELCGADTYNELQPIYIKNPGDFKTIEISGKKAVVRVDDLKVLGVVNDGYKIIQNRDCFGFMDGIIGEGQAVYETAGVIRGGTRLFLTVKLDGAMQIGPDQVDKYILLSSSHDGSMALRVFWTPVRTVCANTLRLAVKGFRESENGISVRHTQNYQNKITEARRVLALTDAYYKYMEDSFNRMLDEEMTKTDFNAFVEKLFPEVKEGEKESTKQKNNKEAIRKLFKGGKGHSEIDGTKWAAFNAVSEFADHHKTIRACGDNSINEARFESVIWGSAQTFKQHAYDILSV